MKLQWTLLAIEDRDALVFGIEHDNPAAAIRLDERIGNQVDSLARFPHRGRPGRIPSTRELVVARTPYIVAYRIADDVVVILRVLHGSQRWPDML